MLFRSSGDFESFIAGANWAGIKTGKILSLNVPCPDDDDDFPSNDMSNVPQKWPDGKWSKKAE